MPVLNFERAHPGACLRLRYEDLTEDPDAALNSIRVFLGLGGPDILPPEPVVAPVQAPVDVTDSEPGADLPLDQIPPALLAQVNQLHAELGYPRLGAS
jgi:hypothetical protein